MGFWKRNWEKISADTVSGLSVRVMASIIFLLVGIVVFPKVVGPIDNEIEVPPFISDQNLANLRQVFSLKFERCQIP